MNKELQIDDLTRGINDDEPAFKGEGQAEQGTAHPGDKCWQDFMAYLEAPTNGNGKRGPEEIVLVKDVREAEDPKGKKWAVDTMDGRSFLTRYGKLAEDAKVAKELDAPVRISYHVGPGCGFVLDSLAPAPDDDKSAAPSAA